jgi:hypothetical protein
MKRFPVVLYLPIMLLSFFCLSAVGCLISPSKEEKPQKQAVKVDTTLLDFGETENTMYFNVTLTGGETDWEIADSELPSWCTIQVELRTDGARVTVTVNLAPLSPGEYNASILVTWNSGSHTVKIHAVVPEVSKEDTGTIVIDTPLPENEEVAQ